MKKFRLLGIWAIVGSLCLISMECHEIIPAPVDYGDPVELRCEFTGQFIGASNTSDIDISSNSSCSGNARKNIVTNGVSDIKYTTNISNTANNASISLQIGAALWTGGNSPDTSVFETFFTGDSSRLYDNTVTDGVLITYNDNSGQTWVSQDTVTAYPQDFRFTDFSLETDTTGTYMQFNAYANCILYNTDNTGDSLIMSGGIFRSSFLHE
jgi:hypothetical protein